ncbi:MAG: MMPL family transporter [Mycobacterium sp.]
MRNSSREGILARITRVVVDAPKRIIVAAAFFVVAGALYGLPVTGMLSAGGFTDPASPSRQAAEILVDEFDRSPVQLLVTVTADGGVGDPRAAQVAAAVQSVLENSPDVTDVTSRWTAPKAAVPTLTSDDGRTGIIMAGLRGSDAEYADHARALVDQFPPDGDGVEVRVGGALTYAEVDEQSERDLITMELIAIPLSFVALVWVFGGVLAAVLPLLIGVVAILGSLAVLRAVTVFADVSIFALNLTAALGLALAVDYTLLIVSRYRDEIAEGVEPQPALMTAMTTAGRTVVFSALTVALSMSTMVLFPSFFLRSFAYAGVAVVTLAAVAAIVITPAAMTILGPRLDDFNLAKLYRRILHRPVVRPKTPLEKSFWYRVTHYVTRHAVVVSVTLTAVLVLLGAPFLGVKWGFPDDRVLPESASSREVGDLLRNDFGVNPTSTVTVVVPDVSGVTSENMTEYASALSQAPGVAVVSAPTGAFVEGRPAGGPVAPTGITQRSAFLTVQSTVAPSSAASDEQLTALEAVPGPGGRSVLFAGVEQNTRDSVESIMSRLPLVLAVIGVVTLVLLFLVTGSLVLPIKAIVLNVLSLTATFGALVWVFQQGNLGGLGTTVTGTLVANLPVLMFCIAFGLSMDYEVFVLSRIREYWLASDRTQSANIDSVARGLARTGRVVTAAAVLMAVSFAALMTAEVSFMKMVGLGLAIAVLVDAAVVRTLLLPALMKLLGRANWWAPQPLVRLHERIGVNEGGDAARPRGRVEVGGES